MICFCFLNDFMVVVVVIVVSLCEDGLCVCFVHFLSINMMQPNTFVRTSI